MKLHRCIYTDRIEVTHLVLEITREEAHELIREAATQLMANSPTGGGVKSWTIDEVDNNGDFLHHHRFSISIMEILAGVSQR